MYGIIEKSQLGLEGTSCLTDCRIIFMLSFDQITTFVQGSAIKYIKGRTRLCRSSNLKHVVENNCSVVGRAAVNGHFAD